MNSENTASNIKTTTEAPTPEAAQTAERADADKTLVANEEAMRRLPAFLEPELRET